MKIPKIFVPEKRLEEKIEQLRINPTVQEEIQEEIELLESDVKKLVAGVVETITLMEVDVSGSVRTWSYRDQQTKRTKEIIIDEEFVNDVEKMLGLRTKEQKYTFEREIRKIYGQKISTNPGYDFMDNLNLVETVKDVAKNKIIYKKLEDN